MCAAIRCSALGLKVILTIGGAGEGVLLGHGVGGLHHYVHNFLKILPTIKHRNNVICPFDLQLRANIGHHYLSADDPFGRTGFHSGAGRWASAIWGTPPLVWRAATGSISISRHLTLDYLEQRFLTIRDSTGAGLWMISEIPEMDRPNFLPTAVFGH